jgi:hypothetical protein
VKEYDPGGERPALGRVRAFFVVLFTVLFAANMFFFCFLDDGALAFVFGLLAAGCGFATTVAWQERAAGQGEQ